MSKKWLVSLLLTGALVGQIGQAHAVVAQAASNFTPKQKKEIGEVVRQYLLDNPSVLVEVSQKLRAQQIEVAQKQAIKAISENITDLTSISSPILGNPQGEIILVQFIDYQCGHCKAMQPILTKLMADNPQLKIVSKSLAILGPNSDYAAKAVLAANLQNKFSVLHDLLEQSTEPLTQEQVLALAKQANVDVPKLEQDMKSDSVSKEMAASLQLAQKIGLGGTPAFVVLSHIGNLNQKIFFAAGALPQATLQDYINQSKS